MNDESNLYINVGKQVSAVDINKAYSALSNDYTHLNISDGGRVIKNISLPNYKYKLIVNKNFIVNLIEQPNFIHRFVTRILLGWKYEKI